MADETLQRLRQRRRNEITTFLFLAAILASLGGPPVLLQHHHPLAVIFALWSLFAFGCLFYLLIKRRDLRAFVQRRRALTNTAIVGIVFVLSAVAAFYGERGMRIMAATCLLYSLWLFSQEE